MQRFVLPQLYCPFPAQVNRHAERVSQQTLVWATRLNLLPDAHSVQRLGAVQVGWLVARAYPTVPLPALQLLADWCSWLFLQDDQCDERGIGKQPAHLAALHQRSLAVLHGAQPADSDPPLTHALYALRDRIAARANPAWWPRFLYSVATAFEASVWEATNRAQGVIPDVTSYIQYRPLTGGLYTLVELAEVTEGIALPAQVRAHPVVQQLTHHTVKAVCFANDIVSLAKELRHGDVHNLVLVLQHHQHIPLQQAIYHAAALHDAEVRTFIDRSLQLPEVAPSVAPHLARYLAMLRSWMRGNLDWSYASGRYAVTP